MENIIESQKERLSELSVVLADARRDEAEAKARRIQAEEAIVALLKPKDKQTLTVDAGNGLKLTIKTELGYKADLEAIERIDSDFLKIVAKQEFDAKAYEELRERKGRYAPTEIGEARASELFAQLSEHVTVAPKKPTVTLKVG